MTLILGDCLEKLKGLDDNSVDLMVTDPPYHLGKEKNKGFMGKEWDVLPTVEIWKECLRVLKPGAFAFVMCCPRQDSLLEMMLRLRDAGFEIGASSIYWVYSQGFPKAMNMEKALRKRGMLLKAKELSGSYAGFSPKPALEVIIVVMKFLDEKTYVEQAMKTGKGITWLDKCRVPYRDNSEFQKLQDNRKSIRTKREGDVAKGYGMKPEGLINSQQSEKGRFPANLLVSDNILDTGEVKTSGYMTPERHKRVKTNKHDFMGVCYGKYNNKDRPLGETYGDSGGFSRYFSLDAWWEQQLGKLPAQVRQTFPFLIVSKPSTAEKNKGLKGKGNTYNRKCKKCDKWERNQCYCEEPEWEKPTGNVHVSVKPLKLMSYLVTLGSKEGDTILDPFMGSGTTGIACKILKRNFIGIEKEEEYFEIAEKRIGAVEDVLL